RRPTSLRVLEYLHDAKSSADSGVHCISCVKSQRRAFPPICKSRNGGKDVGSNSTLSSSSHQYSRFFPNNPVVTNTVAGISCCCKSGLATSLASLYPSSSVTAIAG